MSLGETLVGLMRHLSEEAAPQDVLSFELPPNLQARWRELAIGQQSAELSNAELDELQLFMFFGSVLRTLKQDAEKKMQAPR